LMSIVIKVDNLGKKYLISHEGRERYVALRDVLTRKAKKAGKKFLHPFKKESLKRNSKEEFWALKDVSFEVSKGERIGIIGRNGAGKSTLLKLLSRITEPTEGSIRLRGRVSSLLEVGTGFHPELTGRENVYLNGAILGMSRAEINRKFDEIVEFAEVEKFLDTPVKRYSSGMQVRLAFSVAAHLEPEILLVDEVLAVGDVAFQKKCLGKMEDVSRESGRTILFVSHNMAAIRQLCNRGILFMNGKIVATGEMGHVLKSYMSTIGEEFSTKWVFDEKRSLKIQFIEAEIIPEVKDKKEFILFKCRYMVRDKAEKIILSVNVRNSMEQLVYYSNDLFLDDKRKRALGEHVIVLNVPAYLLGPGDYYIDYAFWSPDGIEHFPKERLLFSVDSRDTKIPWLNLEWPSIIYLPDNWSYYNV
jgi:lipopolysaccharide transport system ATP-binding protein